jgi:dihydrofolate reductase
MIRMAKLVYSAITSLDLFVNDEEGGFEWAAPDEELHAAVNEAERGVGTYLFGRRMYETMAVWDTWDTSEEPPVVAEFAELWRGADKIVFSTTLTDVTTARTRLEPTFDPDAVRRLVADADRDVSVGGPTLAATALRAGLVDEVHLALHPVVVGGGTPALPPGLHAQLELLDTRRFGSGVVSLSYRVASMPPG